MPSLDAQESARDAVAAETPAAAGAPAAVHLDRLRRNYGERAALRDVTLTLAAGQTLVVFGPNGAGKTTLLRILATLLRPHSGRVSVLGEHLPEEAWKVRGRIGLLGHEPLLYRELSARENLRYHARLHGVGNISKGARHGAGHANERADEPLRAVSMNERVEERLRAVSMSERADEPVRALSRGMIQRVAVARATLHDPELLLLDEPYANLDPAAVELVAPLIGRGSAKTRVLTSHDPERGLAEADLVLGLRGGRVALLADAASVDADSVAELYR